MPTYKLTDKIRQAIITDLTGGATQTECAHKYKLDVATIHVLSGQAQNIKKQVFQAHMASTADRVANVCQDMLAIIENGIKALTPDKVAAQSPAAIATTIAILTDKRQLLSGGATINIQEVEGGKEDLLNAMRKTSDTKAQTSQTSATTGNVGTGIIKKALKNQAVIGLSSDNKDYVKLPIQVDSNGIGIEQAEGSVGETTIH